MRPFVPDTPSNSLLLPPLLRPHPINLTPQPYNPANTPTNPITPAAPAAANGTFVAAANPPLEVVVGAGAPSVLPPSALSLVIDAVVLELVATTKVLPFTTAAAKLVVNVVPASVSVTVVTTVVAFVPFLASPPVKVVVGLTVALKRAALALLETLAMLASLALLAALASLASIP